MQVLAEGLSLEARDDDELMQLVAGGSQEAFAVLVRRYQRRALRVAARLVDCEQRAQDVVQEAFVKVYRHSRRYRSQGKFPAFLYRVVLNEAKMQARRRRRRQQLTRRLVAEAGARPVVTGPQLPEPHLWEQLGALGRRQRQVLALRFGADLKLEEIAEVLEVPLGTVKSRLFAGLRALKARLEKT